MKQTHLWTATDKNPINERNGILVKLGNKQMSIEAAEQSLTALRIQNPFNPTKPINFYLLHYIISAASVGNNCEPFVALLKKLLSTQFSVFQSEFLYAKSPQHQNKTPQEMLEQLDKKAQREIFLILNPKEKAESDPRDAKITALTQELAAERAAHTRTKKALDHEQKEHQITITRLTKLQESVETYEDEVSALESALVKKEKTTRSAVSELWKKPNEATVTTSETDRFASLQPVLRKGH